MKLTKKELDQIVEAFLGDSNLFDSNYFKNYETRNYLKNGVLREFAFDPGIGDAMTVDPDDESVAELTKDFVTDGFDMASDALSAMDALTLIEFEDFGLRFSAYDLVVLILEAILFEIFAAYLGIVGIFSTIAAAKTFLSGFKGVIKSACQQLGAIIASGMVVSYLLPNTAGAQEGGGGLRGLTQDQQKINAATTDLNTELRALVKDKKAKSGKVIKKGKDTIVFELTYENGDVEEIVKQGALKLNDEQLNAVIEAGEEVELKDIESKGINLLEDFDTFSTAKVLEDSADKFAKYTASNLTLENTLIGTVIIYASIKSGLAKKLGQKLVEIVKKVFNFCTRSIGPAFLAGYKSVMSGEIVEIGLRGTTANLGKKAAKGVNKSLDLIKDLKIFVGLDARIPARLNNIPDELFTSGTGSSASSRLTGFQTIYYDFIKNSRTAEMLAKGTEFTARTGSRASKLELQLMTPPVNISNRAYYSALEQIGEGGLNEFTRSNLSLLSGPLKRDAFNVGTKFGKLFSGSALSTPRFAIKGTSSPVLLANAGHEVVEFGSNKLVLSNGTVVTNLSDIAVILNNVTNRNQLIGLIFN